MISFEEFKEAFDKMTSYAIAEKLTNRYLPSCSVRCYDIILDLAGDAGCGYVAVSIFNNYILEYNCFSDDPEHTYEKLRYKLLNKQPTIPF